MTGADKKMPAAQGANGGRGHGGRRHHAPDERPDASAHRSTRAPPDNLVHLPPTARDDRPMNHRHHVALRMTASASALALLLAGCSTVEQIEARCRGRLTPAAPVVLATAEQAKADDDAAEQPQAANPGAVMLCTKETIAAEQRARQVAAAIVLAPVIVAAVAVAASAPSGRSYGYRPTYYRTRWRR